MTKLCQPFDEIGTRSASNSEIWSVYEIEWQNLVVFPDTRAETDVFKRKCLLYFLFTNKSGKKQSIWMMVQHHSTTVRSYLTKAVKSWDFISAEALNQQSLKSDFTVLFRRSIHSSVKADESVMLGLTDPIIC